MSDALFDMSPVEVPTTGGTVLSADQRRTLRYRQRLERGLHPLMPTLHPDAPRVTEPGQPGNGPRCGGCAFLRKRNDWLKCSRVGATSGAGSDMRRWWPACPEWEPREATS